MLGELQDNLRQGPAQVRPSEVEKACHQTFILRLSRTSMLSTWLPLILVVLAGSPASTSIVTVSPAQLDTNSSPDVYYTVHNPGPGLLFNVTMTLPAALRPVGFFESSGRWAPTARAIPGGYSISWFGGPIQPGNAADFGLALLAPPRPGSFTSSVLL